MRWHFYAPDLDCHDVETLVVSTAIGAGDLNGAAGGGNHVIGHQAGIRPGGAFDDLLQGQHLLIGDPWGAIEYNAEMTRPLPVTAVLY